LKSLDKDLETLGTFFGARKVAKASIEKTNASNNVSVINPAKIFSSMKSPLDRNCFEDRKISHHFAEEKSKAVILQAPLDFPRFKNSNAPSNTRNPHSLD
jgi:hypothetical protein